MKYNTNVTFVINEFKKAGFSNYYLQMFDESCELSKRIYLLLKFIGMDTSILGFDYTKEMIKIIIEQNKMKKEKVENIYLKISEKFEVSSYHCIERSIRHAKERCLENMHENIKAVIFGNVKTDTNSNFIYGLVRFLQYM